MKSPVTFHRRRAHDSGTPGQSCFCRNHGRTANSAFESPNSEKGSALVEGVLALGLFILVVYGFVQISLVLFGYNNLTYASRVAMRYAVVHGSTANYTCTATDITNMITPLLWGAPSATVQTNWSPNNSPGSSITISVTVHYHPVIPFMPTQTFTVGTTAYGTIIQ